jgi:hypothetical protein
VPIPDGTHNTYGDEIVGNEALDDPSIYGNWMMMTFKGDWGGQIMLFILNEAHNKHPNSLNFKKGL